MSLAPTVPHADHPVNFSRYRPGQRTGHYESFFQRANHPERPLAFWIRYTVFSPRRRPEDAIGELWAIYFDGETGEHVVAKSEVPISSCSFERGTFRVRVGDATLTPGVLRGAAESGGNRIEWDLTFGGGQQPLLTLPRKLYDASVPKAKALVGVPLAKYNGILRVNGDEHRLDDWPGSQNHNWGSRHTDRYAWGQVAGFDDAPDTFLEVATARLKFGPLWTPAMTILVLRHDGREHAMNVLPRSLRRGHFDYFHWHFSGENDRASVQGRIVARAEDFVGLNYYNPPGGSKTCLNTKIARCELSLTDKTTGTVARLTSRHRAAFEILTDDHNHGIAVSA
jgi:hypothetical protein